MGEEDEKVQRRKNVHLTGFDYSQPGGYFVTICTLNRLSIFGNIQDTSMHLNAYGEIARKCWLELQERYPYINLDEFCIMPNHFHAIIMLLDQPSRGVSRPAPTGPDKVKSLGQLIGIFKTISAKQINLLRQTPGESLWQRDYYEHIIRDEIDLTRIRKYILDNPLQWSLDQENPEFIHL